MGLVSLSLAFAQEALAQITLRSDLVLVPVAVRDRQGRFVRDLTAADFEIYDNGRKQPIAFFSTESVPGQLSRPLALSLLLDASGSIAATWPAQAAALRSLFQGLGPDVLVRLIRFHERPEPLTEGFVRERSAQERALAQHRPVGGQTAIFDALLFALQELASLPEPPYRRVILLLTDGLDTASTVSPADCLRMAQALGVSVYVIVIPIYSPVEGRLRPRPIAPGLVQIARHTGGRLFQVGDVHHLLDPRPALDLTPVLQDIVQELESQYHIGYYAPASSTGYHHIRVRVKRKGLRVESARKGYLARE